MKIMAKAFPPEFRIDAVRVARKHEAPIARRNRLVLVPAPRLPSRIRRALAPFPFGC